MKPNRIPIEPFRTVVEEFVAGLDMGTLPGQHTVYRSPVEALAGWADVRWDTLDKVLMGRYASVDFDFADAVITNGPGANLWHTHPKLSEQYQQVDLADEVCCVHGIPATKDQRRIDVCSKCAAAFARSARCRRRKREREAAAA